MYHLLLINTNGFRYIANVDRMCKLVYDDVSYVMFSLNIGLL